MPSFYPDDLEICISQDCQWYSRPVSSDRQSCTYTSTFRLFQAFNRRASLKQPFPRVSGIYTESLWQRSCCHHGQKIADLAGADITSILDEQIPPVSRSCLLAAVCGSDKRTLNTFYQLQDEVLLLSRWGAQVVQLYYRFSPRLARLVQQLGIARTIVRAMVLQPAALLLRLTVVR